MGCPWAVWVLAALWLGGAAGCATKRAGEPFWQINTSDSAESLYQALIERDPGRWSLQGTARARVNTGDRRARLDVALVCERPASLRFDASDFFDHLLFLAVVHDGVLASYSVPENLYVRGNATADRMGELLGVPLPPESLVSLLLGSPFLLPLTNPVLRLTPADGLGELQACEPSGDLCTTVWVDGQGRPLESLLAVGSDTLEERIRVRVTFSRHGWVDSAEFPFRIGVLDERTGRSFRLDFQEIELNRQPPPDVFRFQPPPGASRWSW